jgi:surface polysaccharide O-acyltransferase-like enzyme
MFLLLKKIEIQNEKFKKLSRLTNNYSFGIYLVHVLILTGLDRVGINWTFIHPLIGMPLTTIACFTLSIILVYFVAKIPYGQHVRG